MPNVTFLGSAGSERTVPATTGISLMETAIAHSIDGMEALCGGARACGTCHVYVDPQWSDSVGPPGVDEATLLDSTDRRGPTSRLACQIDVHDGLDGLRVQVAEQKL